MKHPSTRGIVYMITSSLFFGSMGACLKYALQEIPLYEAIFFRAIVSSLILGLVIQGKRLPYLGKNRKILLSRSLAGFAAMSCSFYALAHLPLADAAVLHQTTPLFVALLSALFLSEQVGRKLTLYILIAMIGVVMVLQPRWDVFNVHGMVALLGAALSALAYVFVRHLHRTDSSWVIAFHFASITSLLSLPMMIQHFVEPTPTQWATMLFAGLFGTGGQVFMTKAYGHDDASKLAPFSYIAVPLAFIYGLMFWGEVPDLYKVIGMVIIVGAGIAIVRMNLAGRKTVALGED